MLMVLALLALSIKILNHMDIVQNFKKRDALDPTPQFKTDNWEVEQVSSSFF